MNVREEILKKYLKTYKPNIQSENLIDYLNTKYNYDTNLDDFTTSLINNYILIQSEVMNDIKEINDRIEEIESVKIRYKKDDYERRKLEYFIRINLEAKKDIEQFLTENSVEYILEERVLKKAHWERDNSSELKILFDKIPYGYAHDKRFYDYLYDFSVNTKYEFLLNHNPSRIQNKIQLKQTQPIEYYNKIEEELLTQDIFNQILNKIKNHHILVKRLEIFETLYDLYNSNKYQSFINLAVIQIEGLFYDFCFIINNGKELTNFGTLGEKVQTVFSDHKHLWKAIYPYFAFEMPIIRNKIAHEGFWDGNDLKNLANELLLDFNAVLNSIPLVKNTIPFALNRFFPFLLDDVAASVNYYNPEDFMKILSNLYIASSYNANNNWYTVFFDVIKKKESKKEILEFYKFPHKDGSITSYYEECCKLYDVFYTESFWNEIIKLLENSSSNKNNGLVILMNTITNNFINEFAKDSLLKNKTIQIKKLINEIS